MKASSIEGQDSNLCPFHLNSVHFMTFPKVFVVCRCRDTGSVALCYKSDLEYDLARLSGPGPRASDDLGRQKAGEARK